MGNSQSTQPSTLILQTGQMRANYISGGVRHFDDASKLPENVIHRFLPNHLESKYEALDFTNKFGLTHSDSFSIYNDMGHLVSFEEKDSDLLLPNIGIVCSIGSSSTQAFKLSENGPIPILPVTEDIQKNDSIKGDKTSTNLNVHSMAKFGAKTKNAAVTATVVDYLNANCDGKNIIFVNAIGYAVLGFNPKAIEGVKQYHVPSDNQKVVRLSSRRTEANSPMPYNFQTNGTASQLITDLSTFATENMYVVARQVKVKTPSGTEELSGQWANEAYLLMQEPELELSDIYGSVTKVIDLGGSSGTPYLMASKSLLSFYSTPISYIKDKSTDYMKEYSPNMIFKEFEEDEQKMKETFYEELAKMF